MPGFTGEKCDMRKRRFFVFFEYTQYAKRCFFFGSKLIIKLLIVKIL